MRQQNKRYLIIAMVIGLFLAFWVHWPVLLDRHVVEEDVRSLY